ncbi:family 10 glycosylhydrolase [Rubrivirga marina]|uniref:Fibronectin type-III domain-containing protein n=1 Tax=Rubrivirga marina TaxID=1196024 RepID=A0A271J484_9BACT|nr:family 10 glycosylhydrolase [Rubrivirga marina]PAP78322.1 hypothetical protein BSZ37_18795 [Rubrivirga marina]
MHRLFALLLLLGFGSAAAQTESPPKYEFRGAWVATVLGLDWPCRTCDAASQQTHLVAILDSLQGAGINAVLFQVRVEADAFYDSPYEPWSYWMTNEQGRDPGYDPLAFAIEEAHARGMELHAWFNPYRANRGSGYDLDPSHVMVQHPEWILDFGAIQILDPGLPEVRDYVATIIADVVRRYDVDGVHFDDYFYPYPPNLITDEDAATYAEYGGSFSLDNWRRFNVFRFVRQVRDSVAAVRPEAVFGISPFGIHRPGEPAGITGLSGADDLYADAVAWLENDLIDYLTPQLYWPFGGGQDYGLLAPWWESQRNDRHLYPGLGLYRSDPATFSGTLYASTEVPRQVRLNRNTEGIQGSVFFRASNIAFLGSKGFADTLKTDLFRYPALPPPMAWRSQAAPGTPTDLDVTADPDGDYEFTLSWTAPASGDAEARFYAVYRIPAGEEVDLDAAMEKAENLAGVTGETMFTDAPPENSYTYVVTAVSANSIESAPSNEWVVIPGSLSAEDGLTLTLRLDAPRPNPAAGPVTVPFTLTEAADVTLRVVDVLGREVAVLTDGPLPAGAHTVTWQPTASGTYLVVLDDGRQRATRRVAVIR